MQRAWAIPIVTSLVAAWGCGNSYDYRLDKTLEAMKYRKRLDDQLMPAPTSGKFEELSIFVRPPKNLQPAKEFLLPQPVPGKFDLESSFLEAQSQAASQPAAEGSGSEAPKPREAQKQSLHMLARVKRPKNPAAKKKAEAVERGQFVPDVLAILNAAYAPPTELTPDKFKETSKKNNKFKHYSFAVNNRNVQVYLYVPKNDPYEVALVFEYPSSEHTNLFSKIELCLESFALGDRAKSSFSGVVGDDPSAPGTAGPTPGVF